MDDKIIVAALYRENSQAFKDLQKKQRKARTITIKIKYSDFSVITRSHSISSHFEQESDAHYWIQWLYHHTPKLLPVRLVGVTYSNLLQAEASPQMPLL